MTEVTLKNVIKRYGQHQAVHGIDLNIHDGEFVVLVGPSGCGKSTTLRMIAGLEDITEGEVAIGGRVVNDLPPRERNISMVFQNYALYPHMTVRKNIGYGLKNRKVPAAEIEAEVQEAAKMLNLTEYLDRKPSQLSGGQRQRVAMGRAVVRDPKLFLFDEPLSNLDAKLRNQMRIEIKALQRRLGVTSVYVTHDQVEAMTMADRIIVLNDGRIEQIGTPAEIYHSPASTFVASFMGAPPMNLIRAQIEDGQVKINGGTELMAVPAGWENGEITLGVRPEDAVLDHSGAVPFEISIVEELGAHRLLHGEVAGQPFTVHVSKEVDVQPGQTRLTLNPATLSLFDVESGKSL